MCDLSLVQDFHWKAKLQRISYLSNLLSIQCMLQPWNFWSCIGSYFCTYQKKINFWNKRYSRFIPNADDWSDFSSLSSSVLSIVFSSLSFFSLLLNYIISLYSLQANNGIMESQLIVLETFPNVSTRTQSFDFSLKMFCPTSFSVHFSEHFLLQSKQIFSDIPFFYSEVLQ